VAKKLLKICVYELETLKYIGSISGMTITDC
jgi:hypothetical protein